MSRSRRNPFQQGANKGSAGTEAGRLYYCGSCSTGGSKTDAPTDSARGVEFKSEPGGDPGCDLKSNPGGDKMGFFQESDPYWRTPKIGDYVIPDGWRKFGDNLTAGDAPVDSSYRGSDFRLPSNLPDVKSYPVNIVITGKAIDRWGFRRCQVQFVNDGEPNITTGGKILLR